MRWRPSKEAAAARQAGIIKLQHDRVLQLLVWQGLNLGPPSLLTPYQNAFATHYTYIARLLTQANGLRRLVFSPAWVVVSSRFSYRVCLIRIDRQLYCCGAMASPSYAHSCNATTAAWLALVCLAAQAAQATDQCDGPVSIWCCLGCSSLLGLRTCASSLIQQKHTTAHQHSCTCARCSCL
jgi:hypothetical protein